MKRVKILLDVVVLLSLPIFYFTGCSEKSEVNSPNQLNFDAPQFAIIDYTDVNNAIEEGTIETPITINSVLSNYSFINMGTAFVDGGPMMKGNPWLERFDFGKHLGFFFRRLNLTDEQKTLLKDIMVKYHETMKPLVKEFIDANKDIIADANAKRKVIVDQVKAGILTKTQAEVEMKALNQATKEKINGNPATIVVKAKMCAARAKLFTDIKGILEGDQVTKFENWIKLIKNPC